jgi:hypothetical protein
MVARVNAHVIVMYAQLMGFSLASAFLFNKAFILAV